MNIEQYKEVQHAIVSAFGYWCLTGASIVLIIQILLWLSFIRNN